MSCAKAVQDETLEALLHRSFQPDEFIIRYHSCESPRTDREEAKIKLLAFDFTRQQVERIGVIIRSEARLTSGRYSFTEAQANAILELQLYRLTGMEVDKVRAEYMELLERIKDLLDILARESRVFAIIKAELQVIKEKHATPRLTELAPEEGEINIEDLIANEGVIITITHAGLIKRTNVSSYRAQRRGGKGVIGMATRETSASAPGEGGGFHRGTFSPPARTITSCFSPTPACAYVERVHEVPDMGRAAKGRSIANLLELKADEKIAALIRIVSKTGANKEDLTWTQPAEIFFATRQGTVKKTTLNEFGNVRKGGIIAIGIEQGDALIDAKLTRGNTVENNDVKDPGDDVVLITSDGMSIRFGESDVRSMGRAAGGVRGISLEESDAVVALAVTRPDATLLGGGRTWRRQAHRFFRIPPTIPRRQRHHHHENDRPHREGGGRADGQGRRRNHVDHRGRPDGAHARERHPRSRPQHARRQANRFGSPRQTPSHRPRHQRGKGRSQRRSRTRHAQVVQSKSL